MQGPTLLEQIGARVRFLDIRCKVAGDTPELYHGPVPLDLSFEGDLCDVCLGCLSLNPGETIILLVSNEGGTKVKGFEFLIGRAVARDRGRWYLDDRTSGSIPITLELIGRSYNVSVS